MTDPTKLHHTVPPLQDGWKLKSVLMTGMGLSRKLLVRLKQIPEAVKINGRSDALFRPLRTGDTIEITLPVEVSETILPQPIDFAILYEDEHLLIVNKPPGLLVHPTLGHYTNTLANGIVHYWEQHGQAYKFRPIHRIDQDTSGVIAVAKNGYAHQFVSKQFQTGKVRKMYIAIVYGRIEQDSGTIEGSIGRDETDPHVRTVTPTGAPSTTHFEVIERFDNATVVRVKPVTGRTHQIRVHMTHIGHPLIGDDFYLNAVQYPAAPMPMKRQALHAAALEFVHPETKQPINFEAPLLDDMRDLITYLRKKENPTS